MLSININHVFFNQPIDHQSTSNGRLKPVLTTGLVNMHIDRSIANLETRISEILHWDRKSYLTQAILPRLSPEATYIGCIGTHAHGRQMKSLLCLSDVTMYTCILAY